MDAQAPSWKAGTSAALWSQFAYWCTVGIAAWASSHLPIGGVRSVLVLTPLLPAVLIMAVTYWMYQACDEYLRQRILRAAALTAMALLLFITACYYAQLAGLPPINLAWISSIGWLLFIGQMLPLWIQAHR